jgi:hypothetical protein
LWHVAAARTAKRQQNNKCGAVAKWLGNGLQNRHTWVQIPSAPRNFSHLADPPEHCTYSTGVATFKVIVAPADLPDLGTRESPMLDFKGKLDRVQAGVPA